MGSASIIEPVRVAELLRDALHINEESLQRHRVTVVKELAEVPELTLDKVRVLQILVNLIRNAINAMDAVESGERRLTLGAELTPESRLRLSVHDEGEGIAPENLSRIFNHGFTTRKRGHGFGLHSCALAAKEMGGVLTASSPGVGMERHSSWNCPGSSKPTRVNLRLPMPDFPTIASPSPTLVNLSPPRSRGAEAVPHMHRRSCR